MAKIEDVIASLQGTITELNAKNHINVTMRIDQVVGILNDVLDIAQGTQESQKFDLLNTLTHCTATYKVGNDTISAGANVLTYGDKLKITITADEGYELSSLKVNDVDFTNGNKITVTDNLTVVATATLIPEETPNT